MKQHYRPIFMFILLTIVAIAACRSVEVRESEKGAVITVRADRDTIPKVGGIVCHPKTVSRAGAYDIIIHVKRVEGECAFVTFRCGAGGAEGPEKQVCIGGPPINTGCNTVAGNPISVEVTAVFE